MKIPMKQLILPLALAAGFGAAAVPAHSQPQFPVSASRAPGPQAAGTQAEADERLRLEDLLRMASETNPTLKQAEANFKAAQGRLKQAGLYPNPTVGYTGDEISPGPVIRGGEHGFLLEQTIVTGGKLRKSRDLASQEVQQAEAEAEAQRYRVSNAVTALFYRALAAERRVELRRKLVALADEAVQTSYGLYNVGQADRPDVLEAEIEAQQLKLAVDGAENDRTGVWQQLASAVGNPNLALVPLAGDLDQSPPDVDPSAALAEILRNSPEVKLALAAIKRAQSGVALARSGRIPDISARGGFRYNRELLEVGGTPVGWEGFADIGIRIPIFNRNQGNIEAAESESLAAEQELRRVEMQIRSRFAQVFARYQTARRAVEAYSKEIIPRAEQAYQMYLSKFGEMAAAYPQVLIAQRTVFQVSAEHVSAVEALWGAVVPLRGFLLTGDADSSRAVAVSAGTTLRGEDER